MSATTVLKNRSDASPSRPRIYIAGKIAKNDFRHELIPQLRGWDHEDGPLACDECIYVGPFFQSCDHGCRHGPGTHGIAGQGCDGIDITRRSVFERNQVALSSADMLFAYIDGPNPHGTIFEIAYAASLGIPVHLLFAPGVDYDDLWYSSQVSVGWPRVSIVPREGLKIAFRQILAEWRRRK
ncbi:hypothetical protein [Sphingomonas sp. BE137]|jgi:hypothetical protein|uniref:hypothetical protein n=1 Tax=Sphingomonas sp. BE137 TaxID=2817844 RepID=UPI001AE8D51C|nr:hypothetical protein [Sphingomonas sp. BE137]MDR6847719.1 hypothetical protein [Sphingomonas sp. BE137]